MKFERDKSAIVQELEMNVEQHDVPESLEDLAAILEVGGAWPGAVMKGGRLDWCELPDFGGEEPPAGLGVLSWDIFGCYLIVNPAANLEIVTKDYWHDCGD